MDGVLLIGRCTACGRWADPSGARGNCPACGGPLVAEPVSGNATVFTYTVNVQPYNPELATPYVIALVELAEQPGLRLATNIVDCEPDSVYCGMAVRARFDHPQAAGGRPVFAPRPG